MTVSIIIPVYKVEKYIRRCLESVIDQESDGFNIECLIVDDCSPDGSMDIVNDIIENYQGSAISFKIIKHDVNKGLSAARNTGIKASIGDFLFFIDSDDSILENTFTKFVSYSVKYPFADMIMGNSLGIEDNYLSNTSLTNNDNSPCFIDDKRKILYQVLMRRIDRHAWNKFIRRSFLVDNNLFFDVGLLYEDVTWSYRLYLCVSSILVVPELTYMHEYNPSSIVHTTAECFSKTIWSFVFISDFLMYNPPKIDGEELFFTEHRLFVYHWMIQTIDLCDKYGVEKQIRFKLNTLKRKLFWQSICHLRPVMTLFFLTLFKPFSWLLRVNAYRSNIDRINRVVIILS